MAENQHIYTIASCRSCGSPELVEVLSLGRLYVSNFVDGEGLTEELGAAPLELVLCDAGRSGCGLLQLRHTVSPALLYRNYWYRSGVNQTMTAQLESIASAAEAQVGLDRGDVVVDIGANDGTLLRAYRTPGLVRVGFEPAENLMAYARNGTSKIFNDLFRADLFLGELGSHKAKVVTTIAMFYDLDNPNKFLEDVGAILDDNGLFIIEMHYLPEVILKNAFDAVCHEHLEYYTLQSLKWLLARHGLEVFDVELNNINGGSFRAYIRHCGAAVGEKRQGAPKRIADLRAYEDNLKLDSVEIYQSFARRVTDIRNRLSNFIAAETAQGRRVYVYGASTKGNTLLQFCGLDRSLIFAAADRNPAKWGRHTVSTMIPIISEIQARREFPDYFLVLPWHFIDEFKKREEPYLRSGGKFLVPLPEPKIISREGEVFI